MGSGGCIGDWGMLACIAVLAQGCPLLGCLWECNGAAVRMAMPQAVGMAADGHPELYASPIAELAGDIPLVPHIMVSTTALKDSEQ